MARPELRFVPLLGALFVVLVDVGYLVAGDTPSHHALGREIRDDNDSEIKHQRAAFLSRSAPSLLFYAGYFRAHRVPPSACKQKRHRAGPAYAVTVPPVGGRKGRCGPASWFPAPAPRLALGTARRKQSPAGSIS
jgi:hypothetical protein